MKKYFLGSALLSSLFVGSIGIADTGVTPECKSTLKQIATNLLHVEGFNKINTCSGIGSSDNCQLDFYSCNTLGTSNSKLCSLRYTYGGGYPNYNDYAITINEQCQVLSIEITRL